MATATVLDYGVGNLRSVSRALEVCGAGVMMATTPGMAADATHLVVPGVGAFGDCAARLRAHHFEETVKTAVDRGIPVLGICVGMQLLFDWSEEFGRHQGLGILPGSVRLIPKTAPNGSTNKVPHIGWNALRVPREANDNRWQDTILRSVPDGTNTYFVHSFTCVPDNPSDRLADAYFGEHRISAAVHRGNVFGVQFHPEKSGPVGLSIIKEFLSL